MVCFQRGRQILDVEADERKLPVIQAGSDNLPVLILRTGFYDLHNHKIIVSVQRAARVGASCNPDLERTIDIRHRAFENPLQGFILEIKQLLTADSDQFNPQGSAVIPTVINKASQVVQGRGKTAYVGRFEYL